MRLDMELVESGWPQFEEAGKSQVCATVSVDARNWGAVDELVNIGEPWLKLIEHLWGFWNSDPNSVPHTWRPISSSTRVSPLRPPQKASVIRASFKYDIESTRCTSCTPCTTRYCFSAQGSFPMKLPGNSCTSESDNSFIEVENAQVAHTARVPFRCAHFQIGNCEGLVVPMPKTMFAMPGSCCQQGKEQGSWKNILRVQSQELGYALPQVSGALESHISEKL